MPGSNGEGVNRPGVETAEGDGAPSSILLHHVRRLGRGDESLHSFRHLFDTFHGSVRQFFLRRRYGVEEARDLAQETFLRVLKGRGVFETVEDFRAWLFRIALNVHRNAVRARHTAKRDAQEESLDGWIEERGSAPPDLDEGIESSPLDRFLEREIKVVLARALKALPPKMRRCYLLYLHHEWSYREVADHLEISEGTVKAHIYQARKRLDEVLEPYLGRLHPRSRGEHRG